MPLELGWPEDNITSSAVKVTNINLSVSIQSQVFNLKNEKKILSPFFILLFYDQHPGHQYSKNMSLLFHPMLS